MPEIPQDSDKTSPKEAPAAKSAEVTGKPLWRELRDGRRVRAVSIRNPDGTTSLRVVK